MKYWQRTLVVFLIGSIGNLDASQIAFFYALDEDGARFEKEAGPVLRSFKAGGALIREFSYKGHTVFLVKMGSGCVETALNAQALLTMRSCDHAISTGPVGALDETLESGSWHVVKEVIPWQKGAQKGEVFVGAKGIGVGVPAESTGEGISVASGEVFVASDSHREVMARATKCSAVDMNLFGLVSALRGLTGEQAHYRVISDRADDEAGRVFGVFKAKYAGEGADYVIRWIDHLPEDKSSPENHPALKGILRGRATAPQSEPPAVEETSDREGG